MNPLSWRRNVSPARSGAWRRYLLVALLTFPPAYGLRVLLRTLLVPDLATAAQYALRQDKEAPISEPLQAILGDPEFHPVDSEEHPLLETAAVDFTLNDDRGEAIPLRQLVGKKPIVLVFYYGYYCSHCVSQLFGVNEDIQLFRELGAEVIAISADSPTLTAERFEQFGRFAFPVLSDPGSAVAARYGVYEPAVGDKEAVQSHGTFVIGIDGKVHWAHRGPEPFVDNKTLLLELAKHRGDENPPLANRTTSMASQ